MDFVNTGNENSIESRYMSKNKKKRVLRKDNLILTLLFLVGFIIVLISIINLSGMQHGYRETSRKYKMAKEAYVVEVEDKVDASNADEIPERDVVWYEKISVDWVGLCEVNPEIVGWIYFEDEDISYPVLYSGDNEKYLSTSYDGDYLKAGSIFVDGRNTPDFQDGHTIIYGHNMKNLSMFGKLRYYRQDKEYSDTHRYFQILTQNAKYRYQIVAFREVEVTDNIYSVYKNCEDGFVDFVEDTINKGAQYSEDIEVAQDGKIITLSTCSKGEARFVVSAVLIDEY